MSKFSFVFKSGVIATVLTAAGWPVLAADKVNFTQSGVLLTGVNYPLPPYVAGTKFRTPESPETTLAESVAKRLQLTSRILKADTKNAASLLQTGSADVVLALVDDDDTHALQRNAILIPTGYTAGAMAIMRSDTDIHQWQQLKGRTVCVAQGGTWVGRIAAQYGAIEKVYPAPADSLLAVRTGECDAAVHDDTFLNEVLKLPEWQKFSARLPAQSRRILVFAVRLDNAPLIAFLTKISVEWRAGSFWGTLNKQRADNVAFEVYLDQNVPDCH